MASFRNRVRELRHVPAADILPNPRNWRTHPERQSAALRALLDEVGFVGALIARELPDGRLELIDGHLRRETSPEEVLPVLVVDLDDSEAAKVLATFDPLGELADPDGALVAQLLAEVETSAEALQHLLSDLRTAAEAPHRIDTVATEQLQPHPRNYRTHPDDQLAHLMNSIEQYGVYRRPVVADDDTILAGAGVVEAARRLGIKRLEIVRLPLDPLDPRALKLVAADNELSHFAEVDDRALTELLKEIMELAPQGLVGTGFDEGQLCALVYTTRPEKEIATQDDSAEWLGLPEYSPGEDLPRLVISFATPEDRERFVASCGLEIRKTWAQFHTPLIRRPDVDFAVLPAIDEYGLELGSTIELERASCDTVA